MSLKLGNTDINKGYLGGTEIKKAYLGNTIVFDNSVDTRFITTYNIASNGETLTLPYSGNNETDWGDGTITATGNNHTYTNSGVYTVKISGVVDDWNFSLFTNERGKILSVDNWGELSFLASTSFAFCTEMTNIPPIKESISITNANSIFRNDSKLDIPNGSRVNFINNSNCFAMFEGINSIGDTLFTNSSNITSYWSMFKNVDLVNTSLSSLDFTGAATLRDFMAGGNPSSFSYERYDELLIKWDSELDVPNMTNLTINMGTIQYSSAGAAAHASLTAKSLIISDGGQIP